MNKRRWFSGFALALAMLAVHQPIEAQTFSVLYSFAGSDGSTPASSLILIKSNIYGTTNYGGAYGNGTVFKLTSTGSETVLHSFGGGSDGAVGPGSGLILHNNNLYGTTFYGGAYGNGTVFRLNLKTNNETVLYNFAGGTDGAGPQNQGQMVMDAAGDIYGTTTGGGVSDCDINGFFGCGTVFKLTNTGSETVLYRFCSEANCSDGQNPIAGLVMDSTGNLYGTTFYGGAYGYGTVFELNPTTGQETVLHSFDFSDGELPIGGVILDKSGNLYGAADGGGTIGDGTVFKMDTTGNETVLYNFCSAPNCTDGALPQANIVRVGQDLYGTTYVGGAYGDGTVFMVNSKKGKETVLHSFAGSDGANPHGSLVRDKTGNLYGTTMQGGAYGAGTVFKVMTP